MNLNTKHNGSIGIWKFIYCLLIIMFHARVFAGKSDFALFSKGSIGVEFFFIVSGFLLAKSALKEENDKQSDIGEDTWNFMKKKVKAFFPYVLIFWIAGVVLNIIYTDLTAKQILLSIPDLFLLRMAGFRGISINGIAWYISSLLLCSFIIYPILKKRKFNYVYVIAPITFLLVGGYISRLGYSLRVPNTWLNLTYLGNLRALFEMNLGIFAYGLYLKAKNIKYNKFGTILITIIEIICLALPIYMSNSVKDAVDYDYVVILIMTLGIIIAFSEKTVGCKFLSNKVVLMLERMSLPIFLSQESIRLFMLNSKLFNGFNYIQKTGIFMVLVLAISFGVMMLVDYIKKKEIISNFNKKVFLK